MGDRIVRVYASLRPAGDFLPINMCINVDTPKPTVAEFVNLGVNEMPTRFQYRRGMILGPNQVYVGRRMWFDKQTYLPNDKWGNPYSVKEYGLEEALLKYEIWLTAKLASDPEYLEPLGGKDLGCWCKLTGKCHADLLLKEANKAVLVESSDG